MSTIQRINSWFHRKAHLIFLVSLVNAIVVIVFIGPEIRDLVDNVLASLIIISAMYLLTNGNDHLWLVRFTGMLALAGNWLDFLLEDMKLLNACIFAASSLFYFLVLRHLFLLIFKSRRVNEDIIFASISGYILLGLIGALCCRLVNLFYDGAYISNVANELARADFVYYSFVTLTTLGYGDIVPINVQSKALALFIALAGQLYLTILIAIIVGKYIRDSPNDSQ